MYKKAGHEAANYYAVSQHPVPERVCPRTHKLAHMHADVSPSLLISTSASINDFLAHLCKEAVISIPPSHVSTRQS